MPTFKTKTTKNNASNLHQGTSNTPPRPIADIHPSKDANLKTTSIPTNQNTSVQSSANDTAIEASFAAESLNQPAENSQKTNNKQATKKPRTTGQKVFLVVIILLLIGLIIAIGVIIFLSTKSPDWNNKIDRVDYPDPIYSTLTGEEISDANLNNSPTYCVQIPNGPDGARPQAGLNQAAVVFEAIAESGITRFAAIFQNPTVSAIGPIRSLRPYYLNWDLPFDCTVVHAGGSDEAKTALIETGARDLDENNSYMWREYGTDRGWNNLFTSAKDLAQFNSNNGYHSSDIQAFLHLTPEEVTTIQNEKLICDESDNCVYNYLVPNFSISFGANPFFNTSYVYNPENNTYNRFYANGDPHLTYTCPDELSEPNTLTDCGEPTQITPSVVVAMFVQESLMSDNYHENITTTGTGSAIVFQNGDAIEATWTKASANSQIVFRDMTGNEIKFTPGQLWISAVPQQYGNVTY